MLPNLVIIGAMKCGTTSLHRYLELHPQIYMSQTKELNFFVEEKNWSKGLTWYESNFLQPNKVIGESSPNYSKYPFFNGVPKRMHSIIPDTKLIYIVRDPIERIISHYIHNFVKRTENLSLIEVLTDLTNNHYVNCSKYYKQLEQFLTYYPSADILIVDLNDLRKNGKKTLSGIFKFLEVDPRFEHERYSTVYHQSKNIRRPNWINIHSSHVPGIDKIKQIAPYLFYSSVNQPVLTEKLRKVLANALIHDVENLRAFTKYSFANWSL